MQLRKTIALIETLLLPHSGHLGSIGVLLWRGILLTPRTPSTAAKGAAGLIEAMLEVIGGELGVLRRPDRRDLVGFLAEVGPEGEDGSAVPGKLFQIVAEHVLLVLPDLAVENAAAVVFDRHIFGEYRASVRAHSSSPETRSY